MSTGSKEMTDKMRKKQTDNEKECPEDIDELFKRIHEENKRSVNANHQEEYDPFSKVHLSPFKPKD
ncbi:hypothetical protein [Legionella nagasakiensis]|uniref:hypothetical protein n=1 Tax=Legionella nagasakiensis TaxID=535290 RepID=UPI0010568C13|nr:hypothetical protein [Legionella nagasakiensis]